MNDSIAPSLRKISDCSWTVSEHDSKVLTVTYLICSLLVYFVSAVQENIVSCAEFETGASVLNQASCRGERGGGRCPDGVNGKANLVMCWKIKYSSSLNHVTPALTTLRAS
jgi:hypothetical protein